MPTRVYLTGFMGAGKTTVGRLLAARLDWHFYDIDTIIEFEKQSPIATLFNTHGEAAFRQMELATIHRLHPSTQAVISLGGGALETPEVRTLIHSQPGTQIIFLDAPLPQLIDRCLAQDGGHSRPILEDRDQLYQRYTFRRTHYHNAHLTVATASRTPEEVAASIHHHLAALQDGNRSIPTS